MRKHDFSYFFGEGMRNMFSHGFMSFAAVGITVACLVVMGTFSLVAYNAQVQLQQLESEYEFSPSWTRAATMRRPRPWAAPSSSVTM